MSGGIWAPYKELASVVNQAILKKQPDAFYSLESILKKHKTDFISLLKNPAKNTSHRSQVEKAVKDGLQVPSLPSLHTLPQDFIDEALILSDILDLNEISSVELLLAGEQQLPRFPTLTRGLVAILLYYDGRCSMVASLRTLIQAREGVSWSLGLKQATVNLVTAFTDELFTDGLVKKILDLIDTISVKDELEKLEKGRAIGDARHRQQIIDYVNEQRSCLADCLLHWACQNPFPKDETLQLYRYLQRMKLEPVQEEGGTQSAGGMGSKVRSKAGVVGGAKEAVHLDIVGLALFNALLACFNIGDSTSENTVDVSLIDEDLYPLKTDATFVPTMHAEILKGPGQWVTPRLYAAVEFAWGILLRECAGRADFTESGISELEDDDALVDDAVKMGAIHFLRQNVVASQHFHQEELCLQKVHWLVTSFIVNMPLKVNELRNQGDEIALENAGQERRGFEEFMKLIGDLYSSDPNNLQLAQEYWTPAADHILQHQHGLSYRTPQRQLSLYKFITSCSDLLPAQLFSPFMHMLIGLSSSPATAHCSFNFLKANSPSLGGGGASAAISLDHFYHSLKQYYYSLSRDSAHKATPTGCAITPQELEGLKNVLRIIQTIAKHDETARVVMYENQTWLPVASLFGLVGCPVPRDLKAEILLTLAAFALSPEIASNMWVTLEVSQILNTVHSPLTGMEGDPSHPTHHHGFALREGSIQVELEEIESQAEEYPLTRAFLSLLSALLDVPPPPTLGAGHRVPGFEPYLVFVRDAVFLKFDCRAYQNQEERWEVATLALDVLYKLLSSHEFTENDFQDSTYQLPNREVAIVPKSPGYSLLVHLMNNSQVLRKLLSLLDEACRYLSDASQPFSQSLAHAALLSLKLLENTLEREQEFLDLLRRYNTKNIIVNPLHQLLLGINPRTGKADYMVTIAKYVCVGNSLPELALMSVHILNWVTQSHKAGRDVVTTIISDKDSSAEILGGFVEHLEAEVDTSDSQEDDSLDTVASVNRAVQVAILKLISSCINKSAPNIAHLLLGFEVATGKPIAQTTLQDPGILGSPRTCLHSILTLIEHGQDARNPTGCHYSNTKVAEFCYKVLYLMCASHDLSTPTLRYLRNNHEYFFSQLVHLPLNPDLLPRNEDTGEGGDSLVAMETDIDLKRLSLMHQQAWVLKSVAIELRMTSLSHQRSHTQRIVNLLLSGPSSDVTDVSSGDGVGVSVGGVGGGARLKSDFDFLQEGRRKVLVLLDQVDFADKAVSALEPLEFPHLAAIEQMVQSCETKDPISDQLLTDEKRLLKLLNNTEISTSDVRRLMSYVESRNHVNGHLNANYDLFESWRQLVEVMLHCLVHSDMKKELKVAVLFELIQDLLLKVAHVEPSQLTTSVQGVVLILLSHLRQTVNSSDPEQDDAALSSLYSGPLHGIMRGLMDNILKAPAAMQQAKAYLYGSLLYYLTMTKQEDTGGQRGKGFSLWQPDSEQNNIASGNLSTLNGFGETFMDTICKNACSGHDVARMLSLSLLDSIISLDWQGSWLRFMSQRGFLQTLCASIQWEDESLQKMLLPAPEALKALYIYESKMAFLTRVASSPVGARDIVSLNALNYIAQCSFIEMRPSYYGDSYNMDGHMTSGFIPTSFDRYRQLFLPLLKFLIALLTCPGAHHKEACVQVASFIALHSEVFAAVLKEPLHVSMDTMATLQELSLVTAVISHSGIGQDLSATSAQSVTALGASLHRLQRLMMSLLPHFWSKHNWHLLAQKAVSVEDSDGSGVGGASSVNTDEAFLLIQQITANIVSYCQVAMTLGGTELSSPYCCILLTPDLSEALSMPKAKEQFLRRDLSSGSNAPSLGLLIQHLKECTEGYFTALEAHQQHSKKVESGGKLSSDEMRQLLHGVVGNEKFLPSQQQSLARKRLQQLIANRKTEMQLYSYIIENMLYILWRHLQYYLIHCKPVDPDISLGVPGIDRSGLRRLQDSASYNGSATFELSSLGDGVRTSDLEDLKSNAIKCLTDGFFKKLLDLEEAQLQSKAEMRVGFVQALVRRIRRLLKLRAAAF